MKQRYVRPGDVLDDDTVVVVRGGDLDAGLIRSDAERMHNICGVYGVSVFAVRSMPFDELAQRSPLVRFARLTVVTVGAMLLAGIEMARAVVRIVAVDDDGQVHFVVLPGPVSKNLHLLAATRG